MIETIINSDPTLRFFIKEAQIDWFNQHQVDIRIAALKIALSRFIDKL
jgi:hypothetical protein